MVAHGVQTLQMRLRFGEWEGAQSEVYPAHSTSSTATGGAESADPLHLIFGETNHE